MPSARCSMLERAPQDDRTTEARPVAFRGAGFVPTAGRASGWMALALVIALWQLAGSAGWVNPLFLPAPSAIAVAIYKLAISGALWQHVSASVVRIGSGWVLGTVAGVITGFAIGLSTLARGVGITFISALFPIPKIALLPLLISGSESVRSRRSRPLRSACSSPLRSRSIAASMRCRAT